MKINNLDFFNMKNESRNKNFITYFIYCICVVALCSLLPNLVNATEITFNKKIIEFPITDTYTSALNYASSSDYCLTLSNASSSDWRLPTFAEVLEAQRLNIALNTPAAWSDTNCLNSSTLSAWRYASSSPGTPFASCSSKTSLTARTRCVYDIAVNDVTSTTTPYYCAFTATSTNGILSTDLLCSASTTLNLINASTTMSTTTDAFLGSMNFGLGVIIVLLFVIILGFMFNNLNKKAKPLPWR